MANPRTLRTLGHGRLGAGDFARLCTSVGIAVVVDVRRFPGSRRHPHFGRAEMEAWLAEHELEYRWMPALGGRRQPAPDSPNRALRNPQFQAYADHMATSEFREGCRELLDVAAREPVVLVCAESVWWRCHRRLLADHLVLVGGATVEHLLPDGRLDPHRPTPEARAAGHLLVYDGGDQPSLFVDG